MLKAPAVVCAIACVLLAAARSARAQVIVIDNTDPGFAVLAESWTTTSASGQYGNDYLYRATSLAPPGLVEWRPALTVPGAYQVAVWYRHSNDRPSNAHYTVYHAQGATDVYVDQRINGSQWVALGSFEFAAGTTGRVTLTSAAEPGKVIVADAVRFLSLGAGPAVPEVRACWLTQYTYLGKTEAQLRAIAQNIRAGHMNTVYIAVYTGGTVYWPSQAYRAAGGAWASSTIDYAAWLTRIFHEEGLKVGAWFEYGLALGGAGHPIAVAHPEWLARDRYGDPVTGENGGFVFLSPGCAAAVDLMVAMVRELAENYSFDDIQLDRFRWGRKDDGREYGYEDCTAQLYFAQYGTNPPTNKNNATWVRFRELLVNTLVLQAHDAIKAANPEIVVSSSPTGSYGITQHMQRWSDWVQGGYMDLVMPQMYLTTLSGFSSEFNTQAAQIPGQLDRLGVGFRASEDNDWPVVADQLAYAQAQGVPHGCLWVYHQYSSQIAIQDEIDNLPTPGQPWALPAYNPFASDRMLQIVVDNRDGAPDYQQAGTWSNSTQPGYFRFDSRVAAGSAPATATFSPAIPRSGRYDVSVWYTAASNRNPQAEYTVHHYNGATPLYLDQRGNGGQWMHLGRFIFAAGAAAPRVRLSNTASAAGEYTSSDAVKLVLSGYALGDADGDDVVGVADFAAAAGCLAGPGGGPVGTPCEAFDFDDDTDVDLNDWARLQTVYTGP